MMIHLSHVYKTYHGSIHALKNINLQVEAGEFVFLTGPSGAGKTTLFKLLSAFDKSSSGEISVADFKVNQLNISKIPEFRRQIGMVFQDFKLIKDMTIFDNVALPLVIRNETPEMVKKKVLDILDQVGLLNKEDQYPEYLSGGEQQRTAIARALIHHPKILIADEPTGNLDPKLSEEIMDLFESFSARGTTILLATHDHDMVERRKKRVIKLISGELTL